MGGSVQSGTAAMIRTIGPLRSCQHRWSAAQLSALQLASHRSSHTRYIQSVEVIH